MPCPLVAASTPLQIANESVKSQGKAKKGGAKQPTNTVSRKNSVTHNGRHLKQIAKASQLFTHHVLHLTLRTLLLPPPTSHTYHLPPRNPPPPRLPYTPTLLPPLLLFSPILPPISLSLSFNPPSQS